MRNEVRIFRGKEEAEGSETWSWEGPKSPPLASLFLAGEQVTDTGMSSTFQTPAVSFLGGRSQLETCKMCLFQRTHPATSESHILH